MILVRVFGVGLLAFGCATTPATPPADVPPAAPTPSAAPPDAPAPSAAAAPSAATPAQTLPPVTPEAIIVPPPATLVLKANAAGVQIYACGPAKDAKQSFEWTLKAPEATLIDDAGKPLGKHGAGPTWEAPDGSKVVGAMKAKVDAPDSTAIPWLLVEAKSTEGQGVFSKVAWVQRVQTAGGKAPATGCDKAHVGAETRVDYRAAYYFYTR
jgi:uncharacterized protein DUF3455